RSQSPPRREGHQWEMQVSGVRRSPKPPERPKSWKLKALKPQLLTLRPASRFPIMPRGPKGEKRPADVIGNAVKVMKIATGEEPEDYGNQPEKNQAAAELGRKGGKARAEQLSP